MTKADLVEQVADDTGLTKKDAAASVDALIECISQALSEGQNIEIRGFGSFKVKSRKGRMARNPRTGASVAVPARDVPVFKPSKDLKARVAG
ncbi:MAG: DNA-binding protein [Gemmatimonadetes bacterium]|nr:DNA-binding protein [Gemmatimonadota bacterium]